MTANLSQKLKYILCWFPLLLIAVLNGGIRELWFKKHLTPMAANQISTLLLIVLIWVYSWCVVKFIPPRSGRQLLSIGIIWSVLTLIFEFGFGLFRGNSLEQLLHAYNVTDGEIWILIPIWLAIAPYAAFKMSKTES